MSITRRTFGAGVAAVAAVSALPQSAAAIGVSDKFAASLAAKPDITLIKMYELLQQLADMVPTMDSLMEQETAEHFADERTPIRAELRRRGWHLDAVTSTFTRA